MRLPRRATGSTKRPASTHSNPHPQQHLGHSTSHRLLLSVSPACSSLQYSTSHRHRHRRRHSHRTLTYRQYTVIQYSAVQYSQYSTVQASFGFDESSSLTHGQTAPIARSFLFTHPHLPRRQTRNRVLYGAQLVMIAPINAPILSPHPRHLRSWLYYCPLGSCH